MNIGGVWFVACIKRNMHGPNPGGATMAMICKATIRLICEYLEGRLTPEVASEVQRHLSGCRNCRAVFDAAALTLEVYFDREVESPFVHHSRVA
jgi:predicted anti-sigma-YlaC factor YlaD